MGCDIHITAEIETSSGHEPITGVSFSQGSAPFDWRDYGMYGFLADVRNYSDVPCISEPRGIPSDVSKPVADKFEDWGSDGHTASWLSVEELAAFDFDEPVEDRRVTKQTGPNSWNGGCTSEAGGGEMTTYRKFLGEAFFEDLEKLRECGADRVVFWFDN